MTPALVVLKRDGRHTLGETWTVEVEAALEDHGRMLERRHVGAVALRGESVV